MNRLRHTHLAGVTSSPNHECIPPQRLVRVAVWPLEITVETTPHSSKGVLDVVHLLPCWRLCLCCFIPQERRGGILRRYLFRCSLSKHPCLRFNPHVRFDSVAVYLSPCRCCGRNKRWRVQADGSTHTSEFSFISICAHGDSILSSRFCTHHFGMTGKTRVRDTCSKGEQANCLSTKSAEKNRFDVYEQHRGKS